MAIKKRGKTFLLLGMLFAVILLIVFGSAMSIAGPSLFIDLLHIGKPKLSDEQIDKLIYPVEPKNYTYPTPSAEALNRVVNCQDIIHYKEFPRTNPLCLNLFQTSTDDISQKLTEGSYDRIILYAERSVFDAPTSSGVTANYLSDLYHDVKFMDQIAIPKLLAVYGLADVSYITITKPYPYLYFRISNLEETDKICHYSDTGEKARGCASGWFSSIIPEDAVGPQMSNALPIVRTSDKARFSYLTHYPADCYANETFLHETSHLLNDAGEGTTGTYVMTDWFNEQIAGYFGIYGAELACGDRTVILQNKPEVKDVPKALAEFNSVFPPPDLSHEYPKDNPCEQALLTQWYRYLAKGDLRSNFKRFFVEQRATTPSFSTDTILANFLLNLDNDPSAKEFLTSHGCAL